MMIRMAPAEPSTQAVDFGRWGARTAPVGELVRRRLRARPRHLSCQDDQETIPEHLTGMRGWSTCSPGRPAGPRPRPWLLDGNPGARLGRVARPTSVRCGVCRKRVGKHDYGLLTGATVARARFKEGRQRRRRAGAAHEDGPVQCCVRHRVERAPESRQPGAARATTTGLGRRAGSLNRGGFGKPSCGRGADRLKRSDGRPPASPDRALR